ncbi:winged helix-turn-helix transcriptional regulator [Streptomyces sp. NPDC049555]|uniref:LexA family protein n=1 Tax=Streptomyces sp. NPDC049555 TaxID=3154930 RepID=UPI00344599BC
MAYGLSPRQEAIMKAIKEWIAEQGVAPSVREIGERVGLSSSASVAYHLDRLQERGLIRRSGRRWRSVQLGG